jgi:hypothetical protein
LGHKIGRDGAEVTTPPPEPLPGLDDVEPAKSTELEAGIRRTLRALDTAGHVTEADAGRLALALVMADVIELKRRSGRMSTIGHDARVLMDLLDGIVADADGADDELRDAMAEWSQAIKARDDADV